MNDLVEYLEILTPYKVDRQKLLLFLYSNKISAGTLYFKLMTCSRLTRQDYLEQFSDFEEVGIYEDANNE